jgi:adenosylcobinamide-phosphate synthase
MMIHILLVLLGYFLDRIIGDPRSFPHPVVMIGKGIARMEQFFRQFIRNERKLKPAGLLFPLVFVGGTYFVVIFLLSGLRWVHPWLAYGMEVWLISTTMATKGLADAGMEIYGFLRQGNLVGARKALAMVVGRDTEQLDEREITRGAVETVAENIVDAILSPLFYAAIGGAPLAMAYRAANTLDSMVGYKNERYRNLGWASARFDDLANYIPARLGAGVLVLVCWVMKLDSRGAWRMIRRDARLHPSPNSGFMEAGAAGALGVQLGGTNYYQGIASHRAKLGDSLRPLQPEDIAITVRLMKMISVVFLSFTVVSMLLFRFL